MNTTENSPLPGIMWHGVTLGKPDWTDNSHSIAFTLSNPDKQERLHVILNSYIDGLKFELPHDSDGKSWHLIIDTSKNSPEDFIDVSSTGKVDGTTIWVNARSCVLLLEM